MFRTVVAALVVTVLAGSAAAQVSGQRQFNFQCRQCHTNGEGPLLNGVAGAKIAARADYEYSPALKAKEGTWTDENLDTYLKSPASFAPGGWMEAVPLSDEARAAVVEYLKTLK